MSHRWKSPGYATFLPECRSRSHSVTLNIATARPAKKSIAAFWSWPSMMLAENTETQMTPAAMNAAKAPKHRRNVMSGVYSTNE